MRLGDLKIGVRLGIGFGCILAIMALFVAVTSFSLAGIEKNSEQIKNESLPFALVAEKLAFDTVQVQQFLTDVSATHDPGGYKDAEEAARDFLNGVARFEEMFRRENDVKSLKVMEEMKADFTVFHELGKKMANVYVTQGVESGNNIMKDFDKKSELLTSKVDEFKTMQIKEANDMTDGAVKMMGTVKLVLLTLALIALASGLFISLVITRSIARPVKETVAVMGKIAGGDLSEKIECRSKDEMGMLASAVNEMVSDLNRIFSSVISASANLASASAELHATAEQMATGIEEVASQTGTVAAASEEMAATSGDIAMNCSMAAESSVKANASVENSSRIIDGTVQGMHRISEKVKSSAETVVNLGRRSEQIGEIIGTIEDIADQTNLLALNAAIEAARAGDQGRGFAVVADEVRALASRTTKATKDIGDMIKAIQKEIGEAVSGMKEGVKEAENGTENAAHSGRALEEILNQITNISQQVNQIAVAAEQQTAATGEVSSNIQQITAVVEETSKGVHGSAAAAGQLARIAEELQGYVQRFKLA